jgi:hypothetical protein
VLGAVGKDVVIEVSLDPDFAGAKPLPLPDGGPAAKVEILKATYGIAGQETDVTANVLQRLESGASIRADNALVGVDPAPNQVKRLRVEVKSGDQFLVHEVAENAVLEAATPPLAKVALPAGTRAQYVRIRRATAGEPLVIHELRAFGRFR